MKKHWMHYKFVYKAFFFWRFLLAFIAWVSVGWYPLHFVYLGQSPWGNFDGVHYVNIATSGYEQFQQAFFPLYPLLIGIVHTLKLLPPDAAGLVISHVAFLAALLVFYAYAKKFSESIAQWSVILLLAYPASFFFASVYTESLYFLFSILVIYLVEKYEFGKASMVGVLACATRLFGIFLWPYVLYKAYEKNKKLSPILFLFPLGLFSYMMYLYISVHDPLAFIHVQPQFGANRSGGHLIFLPQVLWRYANIIFFASKSTASYWVAILELVSFVSASVLVYLGWKKQSLRGLLLYSSCIVLLPSLTGTFSSVPRYILSAFPLFIVLGSLDNRVVKFVIVGLFSIGLVVMCSMFLQGYFVS
jgi:hypothetical protein